MTMMNNEAFIKRDRLRFTKNKLSSNLTLLAIVLNALYFVSIYKSDVGTYYYNLMIGVSVVYNLLFMLTAFLSSEGVKAYKLNYSFVLIGIGIGQIIRIFIIPLQAKNTTLTVSGADLVVMEDAQFIRVCVYLVGSAALCIIAGIVAFIKTRTLESRLAEVEKENQSKGSQS